MIYGVTHEEDGTPRTRLAVAGKVGIGLPAGEVRDDTGRLIRNQSYPSKAPHFFFWTRGDAGEWVISSKLMQKYNRSTRLPIFLLDDNIESVFKTNYAAWTTSGERCSGDGRSATRKFIPITGDTKNLTQEADEPYSVNCTCPLLKLKLCKPSGKLLFVLADFPVLGAIWYLHTTSYRSIGQIYSGLDLIRRLTEPVQVGGKLSGVPLSLEMQEGPTRYKDPRTGVMKNGRAHFTSVSYRGVPGEEDAIQGLIQAALRTKPALAAPNPPLVAAAPQLLPAEVASPDPSSIVDEFYTDSEEGDPSAPVVDYYDADVVQEPPVQAERVEQPPNRLSCVSPLHPIAASANRKRRRPPAPPSLGEGGDTLEGPPVAEPVPVEAAAQEDLTNLNPFDF